MNEKSKQQKKKIKAIIKHSKKGTKSSTVLIGHPLDEQRPKRPYRLKTRRPGAAVTRPI
ncbi:hypothetical protein P5G51_010290 [Virgibacillus sp. 179-BFC.A HS]|uniref:Uncharacterized protein n=1 Tax=Tigheibacillus jepli TaxID=3035914 RepID=A0ABU5CHC6_9BACI|nr:hypothetical protein [Virgibacillus sp. 179-BFC.A HS]MDY0405729.1 hypothetical protein [Virgibacillus sp. 179-BFC.A HS]